MSQFSARHRALLGAAALLSSASLLVACNGAPPPTAADPSAQSSAPVPTSDFTVDTPAPTTDAGDVVWAVYRETQTLDPIIAGDYPEETAVAAMCDSLLRQRNDMSYGDGLGTMTAPSETEYDFPINPKPI